MMIAPTAPCAEDSVSAQQWLINFSSVRSRRKRAAIRPPFQSKRRVRSVRYDVAATDIDAGGLQRAVCLLSRVDADVGAGLELALVAGDIFPDHGVGADDDLLLAVLVLDHDVLTIDA